MTARARRRRKRGGASEDDVITTETRVSDEALMLCVRAGDISGLRGLIERHERGLYSFLARYTGDVDLAQDVFQEAFLRLVERSETFDPEKGFRCWLYSIAVNLARDEARWRAVRRDHAGRASAARRARPPRPDEEAERNEEASLVRRTIEGLPREQKEAVLLHYYQGMRYREMAVVLGVPVGTVKSRIHAAVSKMARSWWELPHKARA